MFFELTGQFGQLAGVTGSVTLPKGAIVLLITAHASGANGSIVIFGGPSITVIAAAGSQPLSIQNFHSLMASSGTVPGTTDTIVFATTDHYYIQYVVPRHAN